MQFFLPHAKDEHEAESVLAAIAQFISAPMPQHGVIRGGPILANKSFASAIVRFSS